MTKETIDGFYVMKKGCLHDESMKWNMDGIKSDTWSENESWQEGDEYTYLDVESLQKSDSSMVDVTVKGALAVHCCPHLSCLYRSNGYFVCHTILYQLLKFYSVGCWIGKDIAGSVCDLF